MKSIAELIPEEETCIFGFVNNIKNTKYMLFLMVREETGEIQVSIDKAENPEVFATTEGLTRESTVTVWGKMVLNAHVKNGGKEFIPTKLEIETIVSKKIDVFFDDRMGIIEELSGKISMPVLFDNFDLVARGMIKVDDGFKVIENFKEIGDLVKENE